MRGPARAPLGDLRMFLRDSWRLAAPYFRSEERRSAWALLAVVVALNLVLVGMDVALNFWNGAFYDSLQNRDFAAFTALLFLGRRAPGSWFGFMPGFCLIAGPYILIAIHRTWLTQWLQIRWRRWMTERFVGAWLADRAYYRIALTAGPQDGAGAVGGAEDGRPDRRAGEAEAVQPGGEAPVVEVEEGAAAAGRPRLQPGDAGRGGGDLLQDPEGAEDGGAGRLEEEAGAERHRPFRAFQHLHRVPVAREEGGRRQTRDPRADDSDPHDPFPCPVVATVCRMAGGPARAGARAGRREGFALPPIRRLVPWTPFRKSRARATGGLPQERPFPRGRSFRGGSRDLRLLAGGGPEEGGAPLRGHGRLALQGKTPPLTPPAAPGSPGPP